LPAFRQLECGFGIGACEGDVLGHGLFEFLFQVGQQIGVGLGVDFLAQDALGTGDGQRATCSRRASLARWAATRASASAASRACIE
jgi:hypothetical protein